MWNHRKQAGFTMVELIMVMVILGVLGAIGVMRFFDKKGYDADGFSAQGKSLLRYGQKVAVAQNRQVFARLNGSSIALCFDAACATPVRSAAGNNSQSASTRTNCNANTTWACEGVPAGLAYTVVPATAVFSFDALGRPSFAATIVLNITGGATPVQLAVERETGYVR